MFHWVMSYRQLTVNWQTPQGRPARLQGVPPTLEDSVPRAFRTLSLGVVFGLLAACDGGGGGVLSGGGGGGGGSGAPTASQRLELMLASEDEAEATLSALSLASPGVPPTFVAAGCPAVGASADSDGDGIPDDATLTFTNPPCTAATFRGGTFGVTGTIRLQDTTATDSTSYLLTLTDLAWTADTATGTRTFTATRNGTRTRTATDSSGVLTTDLTIVRQRPNRANTTIELATVAEFVPDSGDTLQVGQSLPSGHLRLSGTAHWTRSTEDWTITLATPVPMQVDTTCAAPQRITSGQLTLAGTINGADGTLTLTWSSCGVDPVATWDPSP